MHEVSLDLLPIFGPCDMPNAQAVVGLACLAQSTSSSFSQYPLPSFDIEGRKFLAKVLVYLIKFLAIFCLS